MKKTLIILVAIILIWFGLRFTIGGGEDTWICKNGEWIKHGVPRDPKPDKVCKRKCSEENCLENLIEVNSLSKDNLISSPLIIEGQARGYWFFEGSFPVILTDWDGKIIAESYAQAQGKWMTEDFVPFKATIEFEKPEIIGDFAKRGALILKKDNPSDLPENDRAFEISVMFEK